MVETLTQVRNTNQESIVGTSMAHVTKIGVYQVYDYILEAAA